MLDIRLKQDYKAPNVTVGDDGYDNDLPKFRDFKQNQAVSAIKYEPKTQEAVTRFGKKSVLVDGAYVIPKDLIRTKGLEVPEEMLSGKIGNGLGTQFRENAKSYYKGAMVGAVIGLMGGLYFNKSLLMFSAIGGLCGGYIGYKLVEGTQDGGFITTPIPTI